MAFPCAGGFRTPVPGLSLEGRCRPPKALQCGPYVPVSGPSRLPYRPPLLLDDPVAPPVMRPSFSSALLGSSGASLAGSPLVGPRPAASPLAPGLFLSQTKQSSVWLASGRRSYRNWALRLERCLSDWTSWHTFCLAVSADPSDPPPRTLPHWLSVRASKQGLALSWMARVAGLPCLQARLQLSIVRAFATATAPTERRESLPLPLSFVIWMAPCCVRPPLRPKPFS